MLSRKSQLCVWPVSPWFDRWWIRTWLPITTPSVWVKSMPSGSSMRGNRRTRLRVWRLPRRHNRGWSIMHGYKTILPIQLNQTLILFYDFPIIILFDNPALLLYVDIDDCQPSKISSQSQFLCYSGVECRDRKAPRRGFDCGKCPKGYVGNGKICQKEGKRNLLSIPYKITWMLYFSLWIFE